ncbi:hypothetical protein, variant [Puccinia triticina 1-1 BBBD Race 1]|uniref:Uncharacterized protein n=2 Tax=Puccinia triticina TaxID=208348 RepID=A0A180GMZ8_PUCT1|nr:uncharacterized protein PtA15_2A6 [Puccinia triticina]OAV94045.1 hypothetical protein, variant [Puccinia triticina 1-1 BBBD Race 1]WAQ81695.1 hypothetical protein PtA15_2A6 [Puccinia triticina]
MEAHDHGAHFNHTQPAADHHPGLAGNTQGANIQNEASRPDENVIGSITKVDETQTRVPFKAKVEGYAKKIAGKTFGKEHEVAAGEARLRGEDQPKHYKQ